MLDLKLITYLESLIRQRVRELLGAADPKDDVLGGVGESYGSDPEEDPDVYDMYLETGVNYWTYPGPGNSTRTLPGDWKILDGAPYSGNRQGLYGDNTVTYTASNESLAVGEGQTPNTKEGIDVIEKKKVAGIFQSSEFSGLLRLFMQAQYGADNESEFQFSIGLSGSEIILNLNYHDTEEQIGFYSHNSAGIVRVGIENDLDYRLVMIELNGQAGDYKVREFPIAFINADTVEADYIASSDTQERLEILAYLFAHSVIEISNPTTVDTFTLNNKGGDLHYGWKFNQAANKTSICLTEPYTDDNSDIHYDSSLITITFSSSGGNVTLSVNEGSKTRWFGVRNVQIWQPNTDRTTCTRWCATWMLPVADQPPPYDYSGVKVYCWYDESDTLQDITLSHTEDSFTEKTVFWWSGNIHPHADTVTSMAHIKDGWVYQNESRSFGNILTDEGATDSITIGSDSEILTSYYGAASSYNVTGADGTNGDLTFLHTSFSTYTPDCVQSYCPGFGEDVAEYDEEQRFQCTIYYKIGGISYTVSSGNTFKYQMLDIYIPLGDSEAVYYATLDYLPTGDMIAMEYTATNYILGQDVECTADWSPYVPYSNDNFIVYDDPQPRTWDTSSSVDPVPEVIGELEMHISSKTRSGEVTGEYSGSTMTYFWRDKAAEDPPVKSYFESYGVNVGRGSDYQSSKLNQGVWTGWI